MPKCSVTLSFLYLTLVLQLVVCVPGRVVAEAHLGSDPKNSHQIDRLRRPDADELKDIVGGSCSVISKKIKKELAHQLADLDKVHLHFVVKKGVNIIKSSDARRLIKEYELPLPKLTPLSERAATYSIFLQVKMLDLALSDKDPELAAQMRNDRTKARVLRKEQHVFGDVRDRVVAEVIRGLSNINKMHIALGVHSDLDISYPEHIKKQTLVEQYILDKIIAVLRNAYLLDSVHLRLGAIHE